MDAPGTPTLGQYLTTLRHREERRRHEVGLLLPSRKFSREKAAGEAHITASYLTKLERDEAGRVDIDILRLLTKSYHADDAEWRYVCDLAGYAAPYATLAGLEPTMDMPALEVFQDAVTDIMRSEMHEATNDTVAFYTPQRRLIAANRAYFETHPTHKPGIYLLEWCFTSAAKEEMVNWHEAVAWGVAWHRGIMGRYGHTTWAQESHRRLWQFPEFQQMWEANEVGYSLAIAAEQIVRVGDRQFSLVMENWQMQHDLPIIRTRCKLKPLT
ncbi:MmyB family transcriptional regulator [Nocardia stercoris]|uniref:HTH cro/C1-type domain-containing protein n=1 Tax=Nocardia stercoris TaxID=2483361 RepID=A0A3M2KU08_9NOCA|nr:helix-turn-helix domain-containing protein [Nocardia stercoris]RMI28444.1 hypothetical protein EBN03_29915 [Nocardia stercoris]